MVHPAPRPRPRFPVVAVCASAGGLEAFQAFFLGGTPAAPPGMAFILVQHLDPVHPSLLTELVQRFTWLPVLEVTDGLRVEVDHVYVIPPGFQMSMVDDLLHLKPFEVGETRLPINGFLRSLAEDQGRHAVAAILSGTGNDGSVGIGEVRRWGGLVLVQDSVSAQFDGMPDSAAATGQAHARLAPEEMVAAIQSHFKRKRRITQPPEPAVDQDPGELRAIFGLLKGQTSHDFSLYKPSTIRRRIDRRMATCKVTKLSEYKQILERDPSEIKELFNDLLIGVTSFFRDPEVFQTLGQKILPALLAELPAGAALRVWSAGCSTGEEAYSLAILIQECLGALNLDRPVQIFATDIDGRAIGSARTGIYGPGIGAAVGEQRLESFFVPSHGAHLKIRKATRDLVVFSEHDILKDPPFFKLDLLVCRNLLIYFGLELQRKLIPLFHYALKPGGILVLGTSETVGEFGHLFQPEDREGKIYRRRQGPSSLASRFSPPTVAPSVVPRSLAPVLATETAALGSSLKEVTEQVILTALDMAAVLVNAQGEVLYLHGRTGYFLEPAVGIATTQNLLKMAKDGLRHPLALALHRAAQQNEPVHCPEVEVTWKDVVTVVQVSVHPLKTPHPGAAQPLFVVLLEERPVREHRVALTGGDPRSERWAEELKTQEEYLRSSTEQMENSNEELRASNEELQSVNEELQSTNEELDTSKEELQSVNEELSTVNAELNSKVSILTTTVNDMNNLLSATGVATVFVDLDLNILRFTPEATRIINLVPGDVGRPVGHLTSTLVNYQTLEQDAKAVLDTLVRFEAEVHTKQDSWFRLRIQPYRTMENVIEGAVISFGDITEIVRQRQLLEGNNAILRMVSVVQDAQDPVIVHDLTGRILAWNPAAEAVYGWTEAEALTMDIRDHIPPALRDDALGQIRGLVTTDVLGAVRTQRLTKDARVLDVSVTSSALLTKDQKVYAITTIERVKGTKLDT